MPVHSKTYTELKPENIIHKTRLKRLMELLTSVPLQPVGAWADFGCSDGFILEKVRELVVPAEWHLAGFDFVDDLLELAKQRGIPSAVFQKYDLNVEPKEKNDRFSVVTCFETMEHVGNYRNAVDNLVAHLSDSGYLIISVPNETGFAGLVKFIGRILLRKNPYGDFFAKRSQIEYILALLFNKDIERFRTPTATEWSQHLGFNYKNLFQYIINKYITTSHLKLIRRESTFFGFNQIIVLQRVK